MKGDAEDRLMQALRSSFEELRAGQLEIRAGQEAAAAAAEDLTSTVKELRARQQEEASTWEATVEGLKSTVKDSFLEVRADLGGLSPHSPIARGQSKDSHFWDRHTSPGLQEERSSARRLRSPQVCFQKAGRAATAPGRPAEGKPQPVRSATTATTAASTTAPSPCDSRPLDDEQVVPMMQQTASGRSMEQQLTREQSGLSSAYHTSNITASRASKASKASTLSKVTELSALSSSFSRRITEHVMRMAGFTKSMSNIGATPPSENVCRWMAFSVVHGAWFDAVVGAVVLLNAICIGIEAQLSMSGEVPQFLEWLEAAFLLFYVAELGLRLAADGMMKCTQLAFVFDMALVITGIVSVIVQFVGTKDLGWIDQVMIIRSVRLFRVVRAVRVIEFFGELWKLFLGLLLSTRTVMAAFLLIFLVMYIFACVGVEVVARSPVLQEDPEVKLIIDRHFDSIFSTMLTLIQFATADSISAIYTPIIKLEPTLAIYFVLLVMVITVLCMNLVTAAIVESAIKTGKEDRDATIQRIRRQTKKYMPVLKSVFQDVDTSNGLDFEELEDSIHQFRDLHLPPALRRVLDPATLRNAFELMDDDGNGKVDLTEFVQGVFDLAFSEVPIETTHMLELLRRQGRRMNAIAQQGEDLSASVRLIEEGLHALQESHGTTHI